MISRNDRVAIFLTNYNMPERTDALVESFNKYVDYPYDFIVVDNGSDIEKPSQYTSIFLEENQQYTRHLDKVQYAPFDVQNL